MNYTDGLPETSHYVDKNHEYKKEEYQSLKPWTYLKNIVQVFAEFTSFFYDLKNSYKSTDHYA